MSKINVPVIWALLLGSISILFAYTGIYAVPAADDYATHAKLIELGSIKTFANLWQYSGGRYAHYLLMILPIYSKEIYGVVQVLMFGGFCFSVLYFFKTVFQERGINLFLLSSLIIVAFLSTMPRLVAGFYWYSSSALYIFSAISFLNFLSTLFMTLRKYSFQNLGFCLIWLFFSAGGTEQLFGPILLVLCFCVLANYVLKDSKNKLVLSVVFVFFILFVVLHLSAPGNYNRIDIMHGKSEVAGFKNIVFTTLIESIRLPFSWLKNPILLLLLLQFWVLNKKYAAGLFRYFNLMSGYKNYLFLALFGWLVFLATILPSYYAYGNQGPQRTLNFSYFIFLLIGFIFTSTQIKRPPIIDRFRTQITLFLGVGLILFLSFINNNVSLAVSEHMNGSIAGLKKQFVERAEYISSTVSDTVSVLPYSSKPQTTFFNDLRAINHGDHWINMSYAKIYGKKFVYVSSLEESDNLFLNSNFNAQIEEDYYFIVNKINGTGYINISDPDILDNGRFIITTMDTDKNVISSLAIRNWEIHDYIINYKGHYLVKLPGLTKYPCFRLIHQINNNIQWTYQDCAI